MAFFEDLVSGGKQALGWALGDSVGARLARMAVTSYALYKVSESTNRRNSPPPTAQTPQPDRGARLQVEPDTEHAVPVVYGSAHLGGIIFDAQIANSNKTMYYAIAICERTGVRLSDTVQSTLTFSDVYWDDNRIVFDTDGITAQYMVDRDGNVDYSIQNLVRIYCYAGSSTEPVVPTGYTAGSLGTAYSVMPGWTSAHTVNDMAFAIVRVDYNREKNITQIPTIRFHMTNSMDLPGDCLYDYMTNTRYGAGIPDAEIYSG